MPAAVATAYTSRGNAIFRREALISIMRSPNHSQVPPSALQDLLLALLSLYGSFSRNAKAIPSAHKVHSAAHTSDSN